MIVRNIKELGRRAPFFLMFMALAGGVQAQYKCVINGKTVYADAPCAHDAKSVRALQDTLNEEQQIDRLNQSIKERRQRNAIEGGHAADYQAQQRAVNKQVATEAAQAQASEAARKRRCANLEYDMRQNQRNVALGQDVGWQRTITQNENELKANRDAYERGCR